MIRYLLLLPLTFLSCRYFDEFSEADYARAGAEVDEEMTLSKGPIESLAGSMEPYLRKLGLPIKLNKGRMVAEDPIFQFSSLNLLQLL